MTKVRVKALADIRSANGNRAAGDKFDYDLDRDPDDLKRLGVVETVEPAKSASADSKSK